MATLVRAPHPLLQGFVTDYYGYHFDGLEPGVHHGLPGTSLTVVIAFDEPLDVQWAQDATSRTKTWALTSGLHDAPALIHHDGFQHGIQFGLTPAGARQLLGLPAAALRAELVPLADVLPVDRLYDELATAADWPSRFDVLDLALRTLASAGAGIRPELTWAWARLHDEPGRRVGDLAGDLGWSRRHLAATFATEFGLGPKQVARLVRFRNARDLLASGRSFAEVAAETGFADQAHLSRDWRDLAGCTPGEWLRSEFPFLQDQAVTG